MEKMGKQITLRPLDIPVALRLLEEPDSTYERLHEDLGISVSTAHGAVERLTRAGLVYPHQRKVNRSALLEFLEHGVQYTFPADVSERRVRGVPTAHAAPVFGGEIVSDDVFVWPHPDGLATGDALEPLYDQATSLPTRCASVYDMLALIDALRVGRARERRIATEKLRERIRPQTAPNVV